MYVLVHKAPKQMQALRSFACSLETSRNCFFQFRHQLRYAASAGPGGQRSRWASGRALNAATMRSYFGSRTSSGAPAASALCSSTTMRPGTWHRELHQGLGPQSGPAALCATFELAGARHATHQRQLPGLSGQPVQGEGLAHHSAMHGVTAAAEERAPPEPPCGVAHLSRIWSHSRPQVWNAPSKRHDIHSELL